MRVRKKFLQLTRYTYPYGTEGFLKSYLPTGYQTDTHGNFYYVIGDKPTTMFTCHLDTACITQEKVTHVINQNMVSTNGKTILGADDKAGMVVLLYMIENKVPGLYYFFLGEEVGCIGSGKLAADWKNSIFSDTINKCVSFDRRGTKSIITHQLYGRCCSDEFGQDLANKLNLTGQGLAMELDDTGIFTDSAKFMSLIPECTNISVGYYNEHTTKECQNIDFLANLCKAVCKIDWESLAIVRDCSDIDDWFCDDEDDDFDFETDEEQLTFKEELYSYFRLNKGQPAKKMFISTKQIQYEKEIISDWIANKSSYFGVSDIHWNGNMLQIENQYGQIEFVGYRYDLFSLIPQLEQVDMRHIKERISKVLVF